nr:E-beta-farnesene synthase [Tanacetum cinerariifolium]
MAPPIRTDDQILPHIRWVTIGKSNCYLDMEKSQGNPIYKIAMDLLKNTNFFRPFTASSTIPSIYIQQLWDTIQYDKIAGCFRCQLDEQWFVLTKDTLREALQITPVNSNQAFISLPTAEVLIKFVNELGYPKLVRHVSNVVTSDMFQPWRALIIIINLCLTGKISGFDRPRRRHMFHPRPDSPLHLPNEEPVLGYLKFNAKGTKREVFRMPIPGSFITTEIREASYYQEYLAKVAQHKRPAVTSTQPAPTSAPAEPWAKKHKKAIETSDKPPIAKKSKYARVSKKCSLKHEATSEAEDIPIMEPQVTAKDAELQKVLEESMKTAYALPRGPFPPVVIREPESRKYQPLPEVPGKGKAKVTKEQVSHDLLSLQNPKKKSPADQYIFQRRISEPTESSLHDESLYTVLGQSDSEEESKKVVLEASEGGNDEDQAGPDPGQAGPDPGNTVDEEQSIPSPVVHAGSDRKHMDLDVADVSPQPSTKQVDEEEPASSSGTLSSLQHLSRDISFGDQFFGDKPSNADKNAETEVESMVNVPIQQALSSISLMTSPIVDLTSRPESPKVHRQFKATTTDTTTTLPPPQAQQQSTTEAMMAMQAPLRNHFKDLPEADMKEILHQRLFETESYKTHEDHKQLFEALEKSMNRYHFEELVQGLAEARKKKKKSCESPKPLPGSPSHQLPPPPPPVGPFGPSGAPRASGSSQVPPPPPPPPPSSTSQESSSRGSTAPSPSKTATSAEYQAWTTTDVRLRPSISFTPADLEIDEDMGPDEQAQLSNNEDIESTHILTASALASNYSPPLEDSLLTQTGDITTFMDWFCKRRGITKLKPQDLEGPAYEIVKVFHPDMIYLQYQMEECHKLLTDSVDDPLLRHNVSKPLPLGGPPGQVTIQSDFFFNKDLEYLRYISFGLMTNANTIMLQCMASLTGGSKDNDSTLIDTHLKDESRFKYEVLDQEGRGSVQGVHVRYLEAFEDKEDLSQPGELCWRKHQKRRLQTFEAYRMIKSFRHSRPLSDDFDIEKVAVCSILRSLKSKRTIESRAKRSSKIISLGHYPIMLASSHSVKTKTDIKSPTYYPCGIARTSE